MKHKLLNIALASSILAVQPMCLVSCGDKDVQVTKDFQIVLSTKGDKDFSYAHQINEALQAFGGFELPIVTGVSKATEHEIVFDDAREESEELMEGLKEDTYIIKEKHGNILIVSKSHMARMCAVDHLLTKYASAKGLIVPKGLEVSGYCNASDVVTDVTLPEDPDNKFHEIRDPFIVREEDGYYMYGTSYWPGIDWRVYYHGNEGSLKDGWINKGKIAEWSGNLPDICDEPDHDPQRWAPEVHKYNNKYYMFTTYHSKVSHQRGVTIFESNLPTGEFVPISQNDKNLARGTEWENNKHITDDYATKDREGKPAGHTIDGTLYVDPEGWPWLVYVNEWVAQEDGIGRFSAVKFKDKTLKEIEQGTNQELFRADDAPWAPPGIAVTDGCFIHTMPSGRLIMTWSADNGHGYSVGFATSDDGITGHWKQHKQQLFAPGMYSGGNVDGGHCMIYEDKGHLFMCLHGPNGGTEHPIIVPVKETPYNTIAWDLYHEGK